MKAQLQMPTTGLPEIPEPVLDQAIAWLVRLRADKPDAVGTVALQAHIASWRAADPLHELAWQELQAGEQGFEQLAPLPLSSAQIADALDAVRNGSKQQLSRRKALRMLTLGASGVALGAVLAQYTGVLDELGELARLSADYATGTGEQRAVALADGTRVRLNSDSAFNVRYDEQRRLLVLKHGEIFIDTGKDAGAAHYRPFWTQTAHASLQALGTQFVVRQEPGATHLTVVEGRVAINVAGQLQAVAKPGDSFLIDSGGAVTRQETGALSLDPTGWIDNALVVKQMPLGQFVQELGRYRRGWLRCDPAVAGLLVSGVFQIDDTDQALESLTRSLPVKIARRTRYWVSLSPA
ncbi:FecR family protein [Herbaspirillum lusitanum]|uniref:FecR family protein n=1 Tax=Herbaspirillum lusitanum TaxID=213312 RepID=A0ABW9AG58_9BURK